MSNEDLKKVSFQGRINRRREEPGDPKDWWTASRRTFLIGGAAAAGVTLVGGGVWLATRDDSVDADRDSLELQQGAGWNVGSEEKTLTLPNAGNVDSRQSENWRNYLEQSAMLTAYQPKSSQWMPFFVPTLIQALQFESLRTQLMPISTPDMQEAYSRAQSIAKDFLSNAENAAETAIIADLPGRASVAFGAGLAEAGHLVTTFDNFPHPLGVTPSHETLAAMLYYAGEVEAKQQNLTTPAPPVFLLDANRLAPYKDADAQFDNRYLAKIPSAQKLQELGIKSVIYVTPDRTRAEELDDLNDDFVDYKNSGLNVAMLPLSDLTANQTAGGGGGSFDDPQGNRSHYYGGSPAGHLWFFYAYPFLRPSPFYVNRNPGYSTLRGGVAAAPISPPRYAPAPRPTMFSGTRIGRPGVAGVGRSKPSGFGRATVRVSPSGGVVGTRAGRSGYYAPNRSGSFGRGAGSSG